MEDTAPRDVFISFTRVYDEEGVSPIICIQFVLWPATILSDFVRSYSTTRYSVSALEQWTTEVI